MMFAAPSSHCLVFIIFLLSLTFRKTTAIWNKMDYTNNSIIFSLVLFLRRVLFPGAASLECGPPFVPMNGHHTNVKPKYTPPDKIEYSCDNGYHRVGEKQSTCLTNGSWRGQMPFCDPKLQLEDPVFEGNPKKMPNAQSVVDNKNKTCLDMKPGDGLQVGLTDGAVLQAIRLFLRAGRYSLKVEISRKGRKRSDFHEEGILAKEGWISFQCPEKIFADSICIREKKNLVKICEVQLYGSDESSCKHPPPHRYVPNGHFIIGRETSVLKCIGSKGKNYTYSICEGKKWKPIGKPFSCEGHSEASHKNLVTIIAASVVSVCVFIGCLIGVLFFVYKRRQTPFIVVMQPKQCYYRPGHAPSAPEEAEYATVIYSEIPLTPAQMRKFPKNVPPNLPDLLGYNHPIDEDRNNSDKQGNLSSTETKEYIQPQDALSNEQNFATLKQSSFYGQ